MGHYEFDEGESTGRGERQVDGLAKNIDIANRVYL